jgi:hypothetical protein
MTDWVRPQSTRLLRPGAVAGSLSCSSALLVAVMALAACSKSSGDGDLSSGQGGRPRRYEVGRPAGLTPYPRAASLTGAAPAPRTCPADHPVLCPDLCCPAGARCSDGQCEEGPISICPPETPLYCEGPNAVALDTSGQGNHAALGSATFVAGRFGLGISLSASHVTAPSNGFPIGLAPVTVEAWIRTTGPPWDKVVLGYGAGPVTSTRTRYLWLAQPWEGSGTQLGWMGNNPTTRVNLYDGAWHFIAATFDRAPDQQGVGEVFVDGQPTSGPFRYPFEPMTGTDFYIGGSASGSYPAFSGQIDEVRVLSYAASAAEIASHHQAGALTRIPGTVGLWRFEEGPAPPAGCCPPDTTCAGDGSCVGVAAGSSACPTEAPVDCGDGSCCPAGTTCAAGGCALPPVSQVCPIPCWLGKCCPTTSYCGGSTCFDRQTNDPSPPFDPPCPQGQIACSETCCPGGSRCARNLCLAQEPPVAATCTAGSLCGKACCPAGTICDGAGRCIRGSRVQRGCPCRAGFRCGTCDRGQCVCIYTGSPPRPSGPSGVSCGSGFCDAGKVCAAADLCCDPSHPQACGNRCCLAGASTSDGGGVACPAGENLCGEVCCGPYVECAGNACAPQCPDPGFPTSCDPSCCATGVACQGGTCQCPTEHPVPCTDGTCCLAGATCGNDGCECPPRQARCGDLCCGIGQNCLGGLCVGTGCRPSCAGRQCGGDDCGGSCGTCPAGTQCANGTCRAGGGGGCSPGHSPYECPPGRTQCLITACYVCCPSGTLFPCGIGCL